MQLLIYLVKFYIGLKMSVVFIQQLSEGGSLAHIAGIRNERGNVLGLMPHPEHAVEDAIGGRDGAVLLGSLVDALS